MARKTISKKTRFEVFKRDSFTCQYCGRKAPDVVLEVDHINPVSKGGENAILNYVTSCFDCNRGKGNKTLSENHALEKERTQLEILNERREQMRLMVDWKKELQNLENEQIDAIDEYFESGTSAGLSDEGRQEIRKLIKKFGFEEVLESTIASVTQYYDGTSESIEKCGNYIGKICAMREKQKRDPWLKDKLYIRGILRNRVRILDSERLTRALDSIIDWIVDVEVLTDFAKECIDWDDFWDMVNDCYGFNGRRY